MCGKLSLSVFLDVESKLRHNECKFIHFKQFYSSRNTIYKDKKYIYHMYLPRIMIFKKEIIDSWKKTRVRKSHATVPLIVCTYTGRLVNCEKCKPHSHGKEVFSMNTVCNATTVCCIPTFVRYTHRLSAAYVDILTFM